MFNLGNHSANLIIDIETLGTRASSKIIAIGACTLDKGYMFDCFIDHAQWGTAFTSDDTTIDWWHKQEPKLKEKVFGGIVAPISALMQFTEFLNHIETMTGEEVKVWGNGASFDLSILAHAYTAMYFPLPWKYWNERCFRTVKQLYPLKVPFTPDPKLRAHDPLDDAIMEVDWLNLIIEKHK